MIKSVMQDWKMRNRDVGVYAGILAGIWLFGIVLSYVMEKYTDVENVVVVGNGLTVFTLGVILLVGFGSDFCITFDWVVGFGKSRKEFLKSVFCAHFISGMLLALEVRLLMKGEPILNRILYRGVNVLQPKVQQPDSIYISLPWIFAFVVLATGLAGFGGMIVHKFRMRSVIALLILWITISFEIQGETSIGKAAVEKFLNLPVEIQFIVTLLLGIAGMVSASLVMKKEAVRK